MGKSYARTFALILRYWRAYGGFRAAVRSPYFHLSIAINLLLAPIWLAPGWWRLTINYLPALIGVTLAAYSILLAVGDERFRSFLAIVRPGDTKETPFIRTSATFLHFIIVQIIALFVSLFSAARSFGHALEFLKQHVGIPDLVQDLVPIVRTLFWFFGHWVAVYALVLALSTALSLFRVATWYDKMKRKEVSQERGLPNNTNGSEHH